MNEEQVWEEIMNIRKASTKPYLTFQCDALKEKVLEIVKREVFEAERRAVEKCIEVCKKQKSFDGFSDNDTRIYDEGVENCITGLKVLSQPQASKISEEKGETS